MEPTKPMLMKTRSKAQRDEFTRLLEMKITENHDTPACFGMSTAL